MASAYIWQDEKYDFKFAFPDNWVMQTVDDAVTRIRISAPRGEDLATCSVTADDDGRLKIYPKYLMTTAVGQTLNLKFWEAETARFDDAYIKEFFSPSSMGGRGDATAVRFSYLNHNKEKMYGSMIGSIHADKKYTVRCTSKFTVFEKYAKLFAHIMGSVQLDQKYFPFAAGYYRNFLVDETIVISDDKPGTKGNVFEGDKLLGFTFN